MYRVRRERLAGGEIAQLIHDRATGDMLLVVDDNVTDPELSVQLINDLLRQAEDRERTPRPPGAR